MNYWSIFILSIGLSLGLTTLSHAQRRNFTPRENIPLDSIQLSDPFILADSATHTYYMTGTGGMMWRSKDLATWSGPYHVVKIDTSSWMGNRPMIWAAELHEYQGKYYYFATFTNSKIQIGTFKGNPVVRRASHILVSDKPGGPYAPVPDGDATYLPADMSTLDATFWVENDIPYMIYCHEWVQNDNGTVEVIRLRPDMKGSVGDAKILFHASDSPWSREKVDGRERPNRVTDGPYVFKTQTGKLGMLWTSWVYGDYTQGVAYSQSGSINGLWVQQKEPITPPNFGHGMLFRDFQGKLLMAVHSHRVGDGGRYIRIPVLFEVDDSGDKLGIIGRYYP